VEIHLRDLDAKKSGPLDIRCLMEAQPSSDDSAVVTVTDKATSMETAVQGAAQKMQRLLDRHFGRQVVMS
jgi:anaerobic ribonucleoside-triphosphate reductase